MHLFQLTSHAHSCVSHGYFVDKARGIWPKNVLRNLPASMRFLQQNSYSMKKLSIIFSFTTALGMFTLVVGSYFLTYMAYHERAYATLSIGAACFIGSLAGLIVKPSRVKMALCYSVIATGMLAFLIGSNYLTYPWSHIYLERAYIVLGIGTLCLLGGIGGAFALQPKVKKVTCYSILALGI